MGWGTVEQQMRWMEEEVRCFGRNMERHEAITLRGRFGTVWQKGGSGWGRGVSRLRDSCIGLGITGELWDRRIREMEGSGAHLSGSAPV